MDIRVISSMENLTNIAHQLTIAILLFFYLRRDDCDNQSQYTEWLKKYEDGHLGKYR